MAIAGPPASGKTTLAHTLAEYLNGKGNTARAVVIALDGFHFDNSVLEERGLRDRKGAPETFDTDGYASLLKRLKSEPDRQIAAPVFDRDLEISRGSARLVLPTHRIILTEGNYLMLKDDPCQRFGAILICPSLWMYRSRN